MPTYCKICNNRLVSFNGYVCEKCHVSKPVFIDGPIKGPVEACSEVSTTSPVSRLDSREVKKKNSANQARMPQSLLENKEIDSSGLKCPECGKVLNTRLGLARHRTRMHGKGPEKQVRHQHKETNNLGNMKMYTTWFPEYVMTKLDGIVASGLHPNRSEALRHYLLLGLHSAGFLKELAEELEK